MTTGATTAITIADRSRTRWRRSLAAISSAACTGSLPQGGPGEVHEDRLEVGFDDPHTADLDAGAFCRLEDGGQRPPAVLGDEVDAVISDRDRLDPTDAATGVRQPAQVARC